MNRYFSVLLLTLILLTTQAGCGTCANPTPVNKVELELNEIIVIDEGDGSGNALPYIWPIFFKIDWETIVPYIPVRFGAEPDRKAIAANYEKWIYAPNGEHENLGTNDGKHWDAGDLIPIPSLIGQWETNLLSHDLLTSDDIAVGVVIVLLEEDAFPSSDSIRDEHYPFFVRTVTERIDAKIIDKIKAMSTGDEGDGDSGLATSAEVEIVEELTSAFSDPWWTYIIPGLLPFAVDVDDVIGAKVFVWSLSELQSQPDQVFNVVWNDATGSEDGDFQLFGSVHLRAVQMCLPSTPTP